MRVAPETGSANRLPHVSPGLSIGPAHLAVLRTHVIREVALPRKRLGATRALEAHLIVRLWHLGF